MNLDDVFGRMIREHALAVNNLTEKQLVEVLKQVFASGDLMRHVYHGPQGSAQSVTYIPFRELSKYREPYHELIFAVGSKHDGETRHETALRYIREREARIDGPAQEAEK